MNEISYDTIPTKIGAAKLRNASLLNQTVDITRVAFGDANGVEYEPTGEEIELKNQVYETVPNYIKEEGSSPTWVEMEAIIPHNVGGWYLREFGCYDDEGDLIFIGNLPESYKPSGEAGVIKDLVFEMVYDAVAAEVVTIKIDPNVVVATRAFVEWQIGQHEMKQNPHPQYSQWEQWVGLILPDSLSMGSRERAFLADGAEYNRADYPMLWDMVKNDPILVSQALIDAEPEKYAANYGDGDGVTTFTVPNYTLRPHLAVAGVFGAVGSTIEDRIQHMSGYIGEIGSMEAGSALQYRSAGGAFYSMNKTRNIPSSLGGYTPISDAAVSVGFNAALVVRTGDTTEVNSSFLNFYIIHGEVA
ncbi:hypothetical protein CAG63_18230 [Vibrio sp. V37_P2S8PM304]|uniref:phage tail protein n=1 Tax=Vibrio sp. V37_P2S8PM304 TaxID=1938688 RepID=UPI0013725D7F|nr:phage tail protein [Vibrio sp. V37_P2S8PM304]NAX31985.1 hypothetical protein [Vibrio sp. V37_P2S8PM304]